MDSNIPERGYDPNHEVWQRTRDNLLREVAAAERQLQETQILLDSAKADFDVARVRYTGLRDGFINEGYGDPYDVEDWPWPHDATDPLQGFRRGQYRFTDMKVGDAVVMALTEFDRPVTMDELTHALNFGGLKYPDLRSINAVLMQKSGVKRDSEGLISYTKMDRLNDAVAAQEEYLTVHRQRRVVDAESILEQARAEMEVIHEKRKA